jgi:pseudaminic acid synthase
MQDLQIGNQLIGKDHPVYIIAELSGNHNGKIENAIKSIVAAKKTGADAIKLQTYTADTITLDCDNEHFQIKHGSIWDGTTLHKLYQQAYTPWEWHEELFRIAREEGITCFSSPFDPTAVEMLEQLNCPAYKIASPEIQDIGLIGLVASTKKPVIISTGIGSKEDIDLALKTCFDAGNKQVALLKCTTEYPAPIAKANLATIKHMVESYDVVAGLSDHTLGITVPIVSVALGAKIIEKHFIIDRAIGGPDASFSLDLAEFTQMVTAVREAEQAIGEIKYYAPPANGERTFNGRSLFAVEDIEAGEQITNKNIRSIRPGLGLHPKHYQEIIGKVAKTTIKKGTPLSWDIL